MKLRGQHLINMVKLRARKNQASDNHNTGRKARNMRTRKRGLNIKVKLGTMRITKHYLRSLINTFSKNKGTQYLPQK